MKKSILFALSVFVFAYLLTAFVNWDINAMNWSKEARGFVAIFGGCFSCLVFVFSYENFNDI